MAGFVERTERLPRLGLGLSTEYGAGQQGVDILALRRARPDLVQFVEIGTDVARGFDADAEALLEAGVPTTYHFLDVNLEDPEDLDPDWIEATSRLARRARAAWLCGDAGTWHVGPRDRGHGTLLPPVLVPDSARAVAESVRTLREASGFEVLPENPPAHAFLGPLHVLDYFARVADEADSGLLLDAAHLAVHQHVRGLPPLAGFDGFPCERVVEMHVAGSLLFHHEGEAFLDDDHGPDVLPATWEIARHVAARAPHLRALVVEAERNPAADVVALMEKARSLLGTRPSRAA